MRESKIERYLYNSVKKQGGLCIKLIPMFFAGLPDRLVLLPGGRICFVETKATDKESRPIQLTVQRMIRKLGFKVYQADSFEAINTIMATMLEN